VIVIRKLDRYLFLSFFFPCILCLVLILAMVIVVETSERLHKLLKYSGSEPFLKLLGEYYLCRIPALATMIAPIITLSGAIAALVRLARHNELMAMEAAGISIKRITLPVLAAGVIAAAVAAYVQEVVVPGSARRMQRVSIKLIGSKEDDPMIYRNVFSVDVKTSLWLRIGELNTRKNEMRHAEADSPERGLGTSPRQITIGRWRNGRWYVTGSVDVEGEEGLRKEHFTDEPLDTTLTPEELAEGAVEMSFRSLAEIKAFSRRFPSRAHKLNTEIFKRIAYPFANIILLLLAVPLVVQAGGRTSVRGIGLAVAVSVGYYVVMLGALDFGYRGHVVPWVAAWAPCVAFAAVGLWMYRNHA